MFNEMKCKKSLSSNTDRIWTKTFRTILHNKYVTVVNYACSCMFNSWCHSINVRSLDIMFFSDEDLKYLIFK